jgi:transketolase
VLNALAKNVPWLIGGAADLYPSTKTRLTFDGAGDFEAGITAAAISTSASANTPWRDRQRPVAYRRFGRSARRSSSSRLLQAADSPERALMEIPVIFVFTHDSIGVGEDGPTHQPVEQLAALRAVPNMIVLRPGGRQRSGGSLQGDHEAAHQPVMLI